jgi:hypothetical protein
VSVGEGAKTDAKNAGGTKACDTNESCVVHTWQHLVTQVPRKL